MTACLLAAALLVQADDLNAAEQAAFKAAAAVAAESVVRIETLGGSDTADGSLVSSGPTSGVIVSEDGLILTSTYAFLGDPTSLLVRLPDGRRVAGERLGTDESRQLALIRVDADGLTPAAPANPAAVRVGDWVVAAGRTYSADAVNVSAGIVSATGRVLGRAVQTDAKTSPANYGGALVNLAGECVGVIAPLTAEGGRGGVEWYDSGIGFAVPLTDVLPMLDRLEADETLKPGLLGVAFKSGGLDAGTTVASVRPQSPAEAAGLRPGDVLKSIAGGSVVRQDEVKLALGPLRAGDPVTMTVERDGGPVELSATLAAELPPVRPGELGILPGFAEEGAAGVQVAFVLPESAAEASGLAVGDVITAAGDEPTPTAADLRRVVSRAGPDTSLTLTLAEGEPVTVTLAAASSAPPADLPDFVDLAADPLPEDERGTVSVEIPQLEAAVAAFVPERPSRGAFGLLVLVREPADAGGPLPAAFIAAAERHGLIVAAPRPEDPAAWKPVDALRLAAVTEFLAERYAVDPARVSLVGLGSAGRVAWAVSASEERYRGVIAPAGSYPPQLKENDADAPRRVLLLAPPAGGDDAKRVQDDPAPLEAAGLPFARVDVPAEDPFADAAAAGAVVSWAASIDRI